MPILFYMRQNVLTSIRNVMSHRVNEAETIIFGFSLMSIFGFEGSETNDQVIDIIKRGLLYLKNDDYNAFEQTLHEALKKANDLKNVAGITHVYAVLANGAFMNKEYEKAKNLFIQVVNQLIQQGGLEDDLNILDIKFKMSNIYELQEDYENSDDGYTYCVYHLENKLKIDPENKDVLGLYALTYASFGCYLFRHGQFKSAIFYFKNAYQASVQLNGEIFEMNVILLNELATLYYVRGMLNKAIPYLRKAEEIGQYLPDMKNFSMIYINLGQIYLELGMLKEAEENCMEGMKNAERHNHNEGKKEAEICLAEILNVPNCKI